MQQQTILVLGATGLLGHRIVTRLAHDLPEARLIAGARHATAKSDGFPASIGCVDVDLEAPATFAAALKDVTDLVLAVAGRPGRFDAIEHEGAASLAEAAARHGARRIVHISGTAAPKAPDWFEAGAAKRRAERRISALDIDTITLRPSWLMEVLARFERSGSMSYFGSGKTPIHWLSLDDLASVVAQVLKTPDIPSGAYPVLGPESIPLNEAAARYARARGLAGIRAMPMPLARVISIFAVGMRPIVELTRMFESFDENALEAIKTPFPRPQMTLEHWLNELPQV